MIVDVAGHPAYAYTGGKSGPAGGAGLVFVHGALHDHSVWTLLARWFAHHGRPVLAVDLPGHGRSGGPPLGSVEALADWLLALLDATGAGPCHLVGHSMGSLAVLEAAARRPAAVSGLTLIATACPMRVSPALLDMARADPARAIAMVNTFSHAGIAAKPSYPGPGAWLHGANAALMHRTQDAAARAGVANLFEIDFRVCDDYGHGFDAAASVRCPVQFILGRRDAMTPPKAAAELGRVLHADVTLVDAGHALMQEAPDAVLAALRRVA